MSEEKDTPQVSPEEIEDLDEAFDAALAGLGDANTKVTEVLESLDQPPQVHSGVEMDEDGNIVEDGDAEPESESAAPEASES